MIFDVNKNLLILILSVLFGIGLFVFENIFLVNGLEGNRFYDFFVVICFFSVFVFILWLDGNNIGIVMSL